MNEAHIKGGLVKVFREKSITFFQPLIIKANGYIYGYYFPLYFFFPWILFFIPATYGIVHMAHTTMAYTMDGINSFYLWLFFMLSQSRRSYYILPIIPFAALVISSWVQHFSATWLKRSTMVSVPIVFILCDIYSCLLCKHRCYKAR